jgi:large subunit ribosomal protein L17
MRHQKQKGKLSRDSAHRKALLMNLSREVIDHERIKTSQAKAKAVKPELERLITLAKKLGPRRSDATEMVFLELV